MERLRGLADGITVASRFLERRFGGVLIPHVARHGSLGPRPRSIRSRPATGWAWARSASSCSSARPARYKGVVDLAAAVGRLGRPDVVLALVGTDPASDTGRAVAAHHPAARLVGRVPIAQVPAYLGAADVVVVPQRDSSDTRGQVPAKLFDAMALGRPVVSTRVSMIPEILEGCGLLVEPGDVAGLGAAIARLLDRPEEARALGDAARRRAVERYSFEAARARAVPARGARPRAAVAGRPMKLGLICRPFSFHGGIETATAGLLGALRRQGHAVELISTRRQPDVPGVPVRRVPILRHPSTLRLLSFALAAQREAARHGYDLVQSHERALRQDLYRAGEGCHRAYLAAMGRRPGGNPYHHLVCALERRIFRLRAARHVVAISRQGKAEIERLYGTEPSAVTLVYNGVDLERFHPDNRTRHRKRTREALGIPDEAWTVLFVGSGFERKGLGPLLEGFARLPDPGRRLVVAGKGDVARYRRAGRARSGSTIASSGPAPRPRWSASTRRRTRWRCPRSTSRSATCTWKRSPPGCPSSPARAPAARRSCARARTATSSTRSRPIRSPAGSPPSATRRPAGGARRPARRSRASPTRRRPRPSPRSTSACAADRLARSSRQTPDFH